MFLSLKASAGSSKFFFTAQYARSEKDYKVANRERCSDKAQNLATSSVPAPATANQSASTDPSENSGPMVEVLTKSEREGVSRDSLL